MERVHINIISAALRGIVKFFEACAWLGGTFIMIYLYAGLYDSDPYFYGPGAEWGLRSVLWGARILMPIAVTLIYLIVTRTSSRPTLGSTLIILCGIIMGLLLAYVPVSHIYYSKGRFNMQAQYHPALQLVPPAYQPRAVPAGRTPLRIFCLGGSTTEWTDSHGKDWARRVEEILRARERSSVEVEVHNFGREWYTSQHTLINYTVNLKRYKPDVILVMHSINDLLVNADFSYFSGGPFQEDYRHFYGPLTRIFTRKDLFGMIQDKLNSAWYYPHRREITTSDFPGLISFRRNLEALGDVASADDVQTVFMSEPTLLKTSMREDERAALTMVHREAVGPEYQWSVETARVGMELYNDEIRTVAEERGYSFIDLEKVIPKSLQYFRDDVHYTDAAFPLIAEHVAAELAQTPRVAGKLREEQGTDRSL